MVKTGGARCPEKTGEKAIDENGTIQWDDNLYMDGGAIFSFTSDSVPVMVEELLKKEAKAAKKKASPKSPAARKRSVKKNLKKPSK